MHRLIGARILRLTRRSGITLGVLALLLHSLMPVLMQTLASASGPRYVLCTASGTQTITAPGQDSGKATPGVACPYCLPHGALAPPPSLHVSPEPIARAEAPAASPHVPFALHHWRTPPPRAPPRFFS